MPPHANSKMPLMGTVLIIGTVAISISHPSIRQRIIDNFFKRIGNINFIPIPMAAIPQTVPKIDHPQGPLRGPNAKGVYVPAIRR